MFGKAFKLQEIVRKPGFLIARKVSKPDLISGREHFLTGRTPSFLAKSANLNFC